MVNDLMKFKKLRIEHILLASSVVCFISAVILQTLEFRNFNIALTIAEQKIVRGGYKIIAKFNLNLFLLPNSALY